MKKLNKDVVIGIVSLLISISLVQFNEYLSHTELFLTEMLMRVSFGLGVGAGVYAFISAILFADIYKRTRQPLRIRNAELAPKRMDKT